MTHRTGAHFVAARTEVADQHHRFRLAVTFVDRQARGLLPCGDDFRIERLARADAMPQPGRPESGQILAHDQTQGRWRRAPGGDGITGQRAQGLHGIELAAGVNGKNAGAHLPGTKQT